MKKYLLALFIVLVLPSAYAEDPFNFADATFPSGPNEGKPVDNTFKRPVVLLSAEQVTEYVPEEYQREGYIYFANYFLSKKKFRIVGVDPNTITNVVFLEQIFSKFLFIKLASHVFFRFKFKEDAEMIWLPQNSDEEKAEVKVVQAEDLVISAEAVGKRGEDYEYSLRRGIQGHFVEAIRAIDAKYSANEMVRLKKHKVRQFILRLKQPEKVSLFLGLLQTSTKHGLDRMYHPFALWKKQNCSRTSYRALDKYVCEPRDRYPIVARFIRQLYRLPLLPRLYLFARNVRFWFWWSPTLNEVRKKDSNAKTKFERQLAKAYQWGLAGECEESLLE